MKQIKRLTAFVLAVAMVVSLVSVAPAASVDAAKKASVSITSPTSKSTYTVNRADKNKTFTIKYKVKNGTEKSVAFKSSNTKVATVSKKGKVTCKKAGKANITVTVTLKNKKTVKATLKLTVNQLATKLEADFKKADKAYKVSGYYLIPVKATKTLVPAFTPSNVTSKKVSYKSSDKKVATVSSKGVVTGVKKGKATITVTAKDGSKKSVKIKVQVVTPVSKITLDKTELELNVGDTSEALKVTYGNAKKATVKKVAFTSSDEKIATVNAKGEITGVKEGKATITATSKDGSKKTAKCVVTVKAVPVTAIKVSKATVDVAVGATEDFSKLITIEPANATDASVTYKSTDEKVATVDEKGVVTGVARGTAQIQITSVSNPDVSAAISVIVKDAATKEVVIKDGVAASFEIKPAKDAKGSDAIKDIEEALKAAKDQLKDFNDSISVKVGDETYVATYKDGAVTYTKNGVAVKNEDVQAKADGKTVSVKVSTQNKLKKLIEALGKIQDNVALSKTKYTFSITLKSADKSATISDIEIGKQYSTFKSGDKTVKMYVDGAKLMVVGDGSEEVFKNMVDAKLIELK